MKTEIEIKQEVLAHVQSSAIANAIRGRISIASRPFDSKDEDMVISVLASDLEGDIQTAIIAVNIYVPMVRLDKGTGEDTKRLGELSKISAESLCRWLAQDGSVYSLQRQNIFPVDGTNENVISNRIYYKHLNE